MWHLWDVATEIFCCSVLVLSTSHKQCPRRQFVFVFNNLFFSLPPYQHNIIKIVREKYLHTTAFTDKEKLQNFLSELYVFLVDQMHISLNKVGEFVCILCTDLRSLTVTTWCKHLYPRTWTACKFFLNDCKAEC